MRTRLLMPLLLPLVVMLYGCPYESPYNLDQTALEPVDENLLGNWTTTVTNRSRESITRLDTINLFISKRSGEEYELVITGQLKQLNPTTL